MERTLVSINFPNIISIGLIGLGWLLALAVVKRVFVGTGPSNSPSAGGF